MEKNVKIISSPFNPMLEVVGEIVMQLHAPYSTSEVTILFNPFIQEYKENLDQPGVQVRQFSVTTHTDQTKTVKFDFKDNNVADIKMNGTTYKIKLMSISKEKIQNQDFPVFEFYATWSLRYNE